MVDQNSQFYAILTKVGAAKQANADALGIPWKITHMAVGDANLTDPMPDASWTSLLNEWRRAPLNQLKVDDKDSAIIIAEQVIPAEVGGRWIREIALFDEDGDMVAVANCAPTYKPLLSQGSGRTQVVRMNLVVSSSSNVQLKIDPSVVLATREFVTEELAKQDFKHSVSVATTGPIVLSGLQTIDTVVLPAGAAVLVKDQVAAKDNGLYVVAAGAWTRRTDADTSAKVTPGLLVHVEKGAINGDGVWQLVTDGPINLGVSALAFEMAFGRTGVAVGTYRSVTVDKYGRVVAATNPTTVAGYGLTDVYTKTQIDTALALKANLAGANFTGPVYVPNVPVGNNSQLAVNSAFVQATLAALVASSPAALDTLNELAAALGNDPNFATTVTNLLAGKADKATTLAGYGITNAQPLDSDLTALAALVTVGFYVNTGVGSVAARSITAGSGVSVSNGDGVAGNPVISLSNSGVGAGSYSKVTVDALGRVTAGSNPTTLAGAGITDAFTKTESNTAIQAAIASLVASSPASLDTLNELAAAIGYDPDFATTMLKALAGKEPSLGFSPVQNGTGIGQEPNKIKIGFDGLSVRITVDNTDFGQIWTDRNGAAKIAGKADKDKVFGAAGQTLKNVTASRAAGVTYTNANAWPIIVMINCNLNTSNSFNIGAYTFPTISDASDGGTSSLTFVVPAGATYSMSGWSNMYLWMEFS